jgi:hypothetical protein
MRRFPFAGRLFMHTKTRFYGTLLCSLYMAALQDPALAAPPSKPLWHTDYEQAKALARQTGKPLCIIFR